MSAYFWQENNIRLRPPTREDWHLDYSEEDDSEGMRVFEPGIRFPRSAEQVQEGYRRWVESNPSSEGSWGFIVETLDGQAVGVGNINSYSSRHGTFSFAVRIFRPFRRKGYAQDAIKILLRYGFLELRCQKANSETIATNESSIRLHARLGFQVEGRRRCSVYTGGAYHDEVLFGMTLEEYFSLYPQA